MEESGGAAASSADGRDRTRRRGSRVGIKHQPGRENAAYGTTCDYIRAQLGDSTYARFGKRFNLPMIPPQIVRKQYPERFQYILKYSE